MNNMIKKSIMCILSVCLCVLVACGEAKILPANITSEQILDTAVAVEFYDNTRTYIKGKVDLDAFFMSMWSDGLFDECEEYDLISDYAICYSNDNSTYEISVLKAKSKDDVQSLVSLLERRKDTLSAGDKAAYDPDFKMLLDDSRILVEENFVILLITHDNDAVITAIENLKQ